MLILSRDEVRQALPMDQSIAAMKAAYASLSSGQAVVPLRAQLPVEPYEGISLFMPAFVQGDEGDSLAVKVVSVFPRNVERGIPTIHAVVVVLEAETGRPIAMLEGGALTAIRTAAGSGAAADLLARRDSKVLAIFGAGVQSRTQVEAICTIRPIETVWVYDPEPQRVAQFIEEMAGQGPIPDDLRAASSSQEAVARADIICTATTSKTPVFAAADLKAGVHVSAVGSFTPDMQEIPAEFIQQALLVVDSREAVLEETGDLLIPIAQGLLSEDDIQVELGQLVLGQQSGRSSDEQWTFFKSVGIAVQDAAAGRLALHNAQQMGLGQVVDW